MSKIQVFISFDIEHDGELYQRLVAQSASTGFGVLGGSEGVSAIEDWSERARRRIREANQVIVICGEHTEASISVSTELRIAQEEGTPYFLLWGRREIMCHKPVGAKPADGMYSWTRQVLQDQILLASRRADADVAAIQRKAARKG
jgi:hypothetical protein